MSFEDPEFQKNHSFLFFFMKPYSQAWSVFNNLGSVNGHFHKCFHEMSEVHISVGNILTIFGACLNLTPSN